MYTKKGGGGIEGLEGLDNKLQYNKKLADLSTFSNSPK